MPLCQLCHNEGELRKSHIVSEFLYTNLYNEKGHLMAINGQGAQGWKRLQKGIYEPLFCEACEQHFNEYCEKPFRDQWVVSPQLPNPWTVPEPYWVNVDYSTFKLFHLSVLFRAAVSTQSTYSEVILGPHQDRLRRMLLCRDPGEFWQYPVMGRVVVHHETSHIIDIVSKAERIRFNGHNCYSILYGGVMWYMLVSSHRDLEFEQNALRANGNIPLHALPWNMIPQIQRAANALRNARP